MICQGASPFCIDPALVVKGPGDLRRVHQGDGGWHQKPSIAGAARVTSGDAGWLAGRPRLVFAVPLKVRRAESLRSAGRQLGSLGPGLAAGDAPSGAKPTTFDLGSGP
jgi:hypothetical protein